MVKKRYLFMVVMASLGLLTACGNQNERNDSSSEQTVKKTSSLENAKMNVDGLFSDSKHTKLLEGTTYQQIKSVSKEVSKLPNSKEKEKLLKDILTAQKLWPDFVNQTNKKNSESIKASESKANSKSESEKVKSESESAAKESASESKKEATSKSQSAASASQSQPQSTSNNEDGKERLDKDNNIYLVKEMHERIDGTQGISKKMYDAAQSLDVKRIKKEIKVINNVIKECDDHYVFESEYSSDDKSLINNLNDYWQASSDLLNIEKDYLNYQIGKNDDSKNFGKEINSKLNDWNAIYDKIVN
ncbi:toxin Cry1Ac domain D-VI-related protein [Latilactobacillus curvatus]